MHGEESERMTGEGVRGAQVLDEEVEKQEEESALFVRRQRSFSNTVKSRLI